MTHPLLTELFRLPPPDMDLKAPRAGGANAWLVGRGERVNQKGLGLVGLARDASGGVYAEWSHRNRKPVVYVSKAMTGVVAKDALTFFGYTAFSTATIHDCVSIAARERTVPKHSPGRSEADEAADDERVERVTTAAPIPAHVAVLKKAGIEPATHVLASVSAANDTYLRAFLSAIDLLSTDECRMFENWYDALDQEKIAPVPYAPTESFAVGDVLTHTKFGMGVVVRVMANKLLFAHGETGPHTSILACRT